MFLRSVKQGAKAELREWFLHIPTRFFRRGVPDAGSLTRVIPVQGLSSVIREEAMSTTEIRVELAEEALREYEEIQNIPDESIAAGGRRYLTQLTRFSLDRWVALRNQWHDDSFRLEGDLPIDIQGKVYEDRSGVVRTVLITRFKLRENPIRDWAVKERLPRVAC